MKESNLRSFEIHSNVNEKQQFQVKKGINEEALRKLTAIEVKQAKRQGLLAGFLSVIFLLVFISIALSVYFWFNKEQVVEKVIDITVLRLLEDVAQTFPDGYMTRNGDRVLDVFDKFVNAAAANKVSKNSYKIIAKSIMVALNDRKLNYHEINNIVNQMERAANSYR